MEPKALADLDIVVAMRDQKGYAPRHWKSNVKLANAQGSGTPIICNREMGYLETASLEERWADTKEELFAALDALAPHDVRSAAHDGLRAFAPALDVVAADYLAWLKVVAGKG